MRTHAKASKEITIGPAMASGSPLAGEADPRPIIGARWNPDLQGLSLRASGRLWAIEVDSFFGAERRFVEVEGKGGLKICASPGPGRLRSTSEEILKDIPEALRVTEVL